MTEQGYPPSRPGHPGRTGRSKISHEPRGSGWQAFEPVADTDGDLPPWAGLGGVEPIRPARKPAAAVVDVTDEPRAGGEPGQEPPPQPTRKRGRSRAAATRRRRYRRRLAALGLVLALAAVIVFAVVVFAGQPAAVVGGPITTYQKGEYNVTPDACRAVSAAMLGQYLGPAPKTIRPVPGQCTFTIDAKPRFRELNLQVQALPPNAGYGNGSATADARYSFSHQRAQLAKPPKGTPEPPAAITPIGLGDSAIIAVQVFRNGVISNKVTVLVRYRNVLITTYLLGEVSNGFGPAPVSDLRAGALATARALLTSVKAQQAVS